MTRHTIVEFWKELERCRDQLQLLIKDEGASIAGVSSYSWLQFGLALSTLEAARRSIGRDIDELKRLHAAVDGDMPPLPNPRTPT
jgi:hypothetical protein